MSRFVGEAFFRNMSEIASNPSTVVFSTLLNGVYGGGEGPMTSRHLRLPQKFDIQECLPSGLVETRIFTPTLYRLICSSAFKGDHDIYCTTNTTLELGKV